MKLGILISEEVKTTLGKFSEEQLPFDVCIELIKLIELIRRKEIEIDETRIGALLKYGSKSEDGKLLTDEQGNVQIKEEFIESFTNELSEKYNEEVSFVKINYTKLLGKMKFDYTCKELITINEVLQIMHTPQ
jgi:hypothetical protein